MLEDLTPDSVFSQVLMEDPPPRAILLVEGPDEDALLFEHLSEGVVRIIAGGKRAVLGAAQTALDTGMTNVFGLVDRDLDSLRGRDVYPANVVATGSYDLLADLVAVLGDDALRRVMSAHAAPSVRVAETASGRRVPDIVFELAGPLAAVRLASLRSHYPLVLAKYDFRHALTEKFEAADVSVYVLNAKCKNEKFAIDNALIEDIRDHLAEVSDRRHIGGHDLVGAIGAVIAQAGGRVSKDAIAGNIISFANCGVLARVTSLQKLHATARATLGIGLLDCMAA